MPVFILDDGPFGQLAKLVCPEDLSNWPVGKLFVAEQTAEDAKRDHARRAILMANPTPFSTFKILMGAQAFKIVYNHLRRTQSRATANLAEHQSIAWILAERNDGVFVTEDKKAAFLALAELGSGRVAHSHDLWLYLRENGLVEKVIFDKLCQATIKVDQSIIPWRISNSIW